MLEELNANTGLERGNDRSEFRAEISWTQRKMLLKTQMSDLENLAKYQKMSPESEYSMLW